MVKRSVKSLKQLCTVSALSVALWSCGGGSITTNTVVDPSTATPPVSAADPGANDTGWSLIWADEFDGSSIDLNNWTHEVNCDGGGNQERQCYTDDPANSFVSDGMLNIVAMPTPAESGLPLPYTSARLNTQFKQDFTYGRFEMRAKLPFGQGSWPAFWMLSTDETYGTWPRSGEIDIMEAVNLKTVNAEGEEYGTIVGTLHYGDGRGGGDCSFSVCTGQGYEPPANPADEFHVYAVEWQEGEVRWYVDDVLYATQRQSTERTTPDGTVIGLSHRGWWLPRFSPLTGEMEDTYTAAPFDQDFYLILNLAVGGNFPEAVNNGGVDASAFENGQTYQIDYVRAYECSTDPMTGKGCESVAPNYDVPEEDGGLLVEGGAPIPLPPSTGPAAPIIIFDDTVNEDWALWDCCGGTTPEVVMDEDASRGGVAQFQINDNNGTVLGFNTRESGGGNGVPYDASSLIGNGSLSFDLKIVTPPTANTTWLVKVEGNNSPSPAFEVPLNTSNEGVDPVVGQWQTFTFPIEAIADAGTQVAAIDVIMVFPAWQTGEGAVYRIDNVRIGPDEFNSPELTLFADDVNADWVLWDCCGGTQPEIVMDEDASQGAVAEFTILDNNGTVLGFNTRTDVGGNGVPFNATPILSNGVLQFDMKVVTPPSQNGADTTWLVKVEGNGLPSPAFEVNLNTSNEGVNPVVGEWQTYTFPLSDILDAGTDVSAIDVVMIFPAWQTGAGAIYRVDNVRIYDPNATGAPSGPLLAAFTDGSDSGWALWDCCGGTTPEVVMDEDASQGAVAEFTINDNNGTVLGFNTRTDAGGAGTPFDATSIINTGVVQFDMKVVTPPSADTFWLIKVEGDNTPSPAFEVNLNTSMEGMDPVVGEWQTYTFPLTSLLDAGVPINAIDVIMIFPAWQTGAGAVYRVDNVYIGNPSDIAGGGSGGGSSNAALTLFADMVNEDWPLWDCCGGTQPTVEMDDAEHGATAQFEILDNNGTVLGFNNRADQGGSGVPFDASSIVATGKFQFEMKVVTAPDQADTNWLIKIEGAGLPSPAFEVNLNTSMEGMDPVVGEWQTYTFDLLTILDSGVDISAIDVVMVFPAWQTGQGAVYRLDNVVFTEN